MFYVYLLPENLHCASWKSHQYPFCKTEPWQVYGDWEGSLHWYVWAWSGRRCFYFHKILGGTWCLSRMFAVRTDLNRSIEICLDPHWTIGLFRLRLVGCRIIVGFRVIGTETPSHRSQSVWLFAMQICEVDSSTWNWSPTTCHQPPEPVQS